jgi:hypothetical protein
MATKEPMRDLLINELLRNSIYLNKKEKLSDIEKYYDETKFKYLINELKELNYELKDETDNKKKEQIENKINKLTAEKNKVDEYNKNKEELTKFISDLKGNKNEKIYNNYLYPYFQNSISSKRIKIEKEKNNLEELVNTYVSIITSSNTLDNKDNFNKYLKYMKEKIDGKTNIMLLQKNASIEKNKSDADTESDDSTESNSEAESYSFSDNKREFESDEREFSNNFMSGGNKKETETDNIVENNETNKQIVVRNVSKFRTELIELNKSFNKYWDDQYDGLNNLIKNLNKNVEKYNKIDIKIDDGKISREFISNLSKIYNKNIDIIDNALLDSNNLIDKTFNGTNGLLKTTESLLDIISELKTLLINNYNIIYNDKSDKISNIKYLDNILEIISNKFKTKFRDIYNKIVDFNEYIKKYKFEYDNKYNTLINKINNSNNSNNDQYRGFNDSFEDHYNRDRNNTDNLLEIKNLLREFNNLQKEFNNNDLIKDLKILHNSIIFDDYKFKVSKPINQKLDDIENKLEPSEVKNVSFTNNSGEEVNYNSFDNIFNRIWNQYIKDIKRNTKLRKEVDSDFYNSIKRNDLNPEVVLDISSTDKIIFIILLFVIRQLSLYICDYLLNNNNVTQFKYLLFMYTALYIIILFGFLIFINIDDYKLRILFNYLNLHINGTNIFSHITLFILFILIIYYFIYSVDSNIKNRNTDELTEEEKIDYKYKLDIITLIIYVFSSIIIYLT